MRPPALSLTHSLLQTLAFVHSRLARTQEWVWTARSSACSLIGNRDDLEGDIWCHSIRPTQDGNFLTSHCVRDWRSNWNWLTPVARGISVSKTSAALDNERDTRLKLASDLQVDDTRISPYYLIYYGNEHRALPYKYQWVAKHQLHIHHLSTYPHSRTQWS